MKRLQVLVTVLITVLLISTSFTSSVVGQPSKEPKIQNETPQNYLVGFKDKAKGYSKAEQKGKVKRNYKHMPAAAIQMTPAQARELLSDPDIMYVEPDGQVAINETVPWNVAQVNADAAVTSGITGQGINIAVLDSGIDPTNQDLNVAGGVSFIEGSDGYADDNGHGTHVAGIIAARQNGLGTVGVAPEANLYAVKVLDRYGMGTYSNVIAAIDWSIDNGMNIINMSFSGGQPSQALAQAMQTAYDNGILMVSAAGNQGDTGELLYPARYPEVIAVGAVDQHNQRANFSGTGAELELVAPGVNIASTALDGGLISKTGTSTAAAHVTGVAALVWSEQPGLTNAQVRTKLDQAALALGEKNFYGNGLVDAAAVLGLQPSSSSGQINEGETGTPAPGLPEANIPPDILEISQINNALQQDEESGRRAALVALDSLYPEVRMYAVRLLGGIGKAVDLKALRKFTAGKDIEQTIADQAALSVAKIEIRQAANLQAQLSIITGFFKSSYDIVHDYAIYLLSSINHPQAPIVAETAMAIEQDPLRQEALAALARGEQYPVDGSQFDFKPEGTIYLQAYNQTGNNAIVLQANSHNVSLQVSSFQSRIDISVYAVHDPETIIDLESRYNIPANGSVYYTWNTGSAAIGTYKIHYRYVDYPGVQDIFTVWVASP